MTRLHTLPEHWSFRAFKDVCYTVSINKIKVKQKDYLAHGNYPIIDQGADLIGGYCNDPNMLIKTEPPFIVFGDHTKVKKYIQFKFIAGADGIKVLKVKEGIEPRFFYYLLHYIPLPEKGYARHFQYIDKVRFPIPNIEEQRRIANKIDALYYELESCLRLLETVKEQLKTYRQAVLKSAFCGILTNIRTRDGELPAGWKIEKFIDFCKLQRGYDLPLKNLKAGIFPVITSSGIKGYHNDFKALGPCLITGRSGGVGNIHYNEFDKYWPHNTVLFVKDFCGNDPKFMYYFFLQFNFIAFSASTTIPTLDRKQLYKELVKVPPLIQQEQIVKEIESRFQRTEILEKTIEKAISQVEAIKQSILKQAFEGNLIKPQIN